MSLTIDPRFPKLICKQFVNGHVRFLLSINFKKEDIETLIKNGEGTFDVDLYDKKSKYLYKRSKQNLKGVYRFYIKGDNIFYCKDGGLSHLLRDTFKYDYYVKSHPISYPISGMCAGYVLSNIF